YEVFAHTADIGLRVRAANLNELFTDAAKGLFSLILCNLDDVRQNDKVHFVVPGSEDQYDLLLFDWLNELLFTFDSQRMVLVEFDLEVTPTGLVARAQGELLDPVRHRLDHEVKAITYHGLKVALQSNGWMAEVIVDI